MTGWFKVWRELLTSVLWLTEPFTRGQAFIDLIGLANHADGFIRVRGNRVEIKRGQCGWSEVKLAERWKWSRGRVRRFLTELKNDGRIEQQKNTITSLISLTNYERYQGDDTADGTADGQQTDSRRYPNKKDKKDKKEKKTPYSPPKGDGQQSSGVEATFEHWNSYAGRTVEKDGKRISWKSHKALSPEIRDAATARLKDYGVDAICAGIANYAIVLLGPEYYWSYPWALFEFLTRKQGKEKGSPLQLLQFLPDNFIVDRYLGKRFTNGRAEPSIAELAGCEPADEEDARKLYQEAGLIQE